MAAPAGARRVAFVADVLHSSGGLEIFEHGAARGLAERGWDVTVFYRRGGDLEASWSSFARMRQGIDVAADAVVASAADVVYVHPEQRFVDAVAAARRASRPVVAHLHLPPEHVRTGWRAAVRGRYRWPMPPEVFSSATEVARFIAVSRHTADEWVTGAGLPASRVEVVHNGVDLDVFRPAAPGERDAVRTELGLRPDDVAIGFAGRIDPAKGVAELLRAVERIRRRRPDVRLVLVGEATRALEERGDHFQATMRAAAGDSVLWLGKRTDMDRVYRAFDLCVVPSRWHEPFGLVVVEAMASGVPVVASRRGGICEILTGDLADWLCEPTVRGLRRAVGRRLDVAALRREGARARRHVEEGFGIERTLDGIEGVLDRAIASSRRGVDLSEERT